MSGRRFRVGQTVAAALIPLDIGRRSVKRSLPPDNGPDMFEARTLTLALLAIATLCHGSSLSAAELTLPAGFKAQVFHEGIGPRARHIAV